LRGIYKLAAADPLGDWPQVHLFGSGAILREAWRAQDLLAERQVAAHVWSVTSWTELRRDAMAARRWNMLHPLETPRQSYLEEVLAPEPYPIIAVSDYLKIVADGLAPFTPAGLFPLGTDGFGRSEDRATLRRFFEVDAESIAVAALHVLAQRGQIAPDVVAQALEEFGIAADKPDPAVS
jgi:pyruvate dehydrogenase E1 component